MNPKYVLIQPKDRNLLPVCYKVRNVIEEHTNTITLDIEAYGVRTFRKKDKHTFFNRLPYGYGGI